MNSIGNVYLQQVVEQLVFKITRFGRNMGVEFDLVLRSHNVPGMPWFLKGLNRG